MTDVDLKNALMAGQYDDNDDGEQERTIPTSAGPIVVRRLSRAEVLKLKAGRMSGDLDIAEYEAEMVSIALVSPTMTAAEVAVWQTADKAGGVLGKVTEAIADLSGLAEGAEKSGVPGLSR